MTGYLHESYAAALSEFGHPRRLSRCGGWILEREIPDSTLRDAMGCYPLFCCERWSALRDDLSDLEAESRLASLVLVSDPFGSCTEADLQRCFDFVTPFKMHVVVDLESADTGTSRHHRYYGRKALRNVSIEHCPNPAERVDEWSGLYGVLARRHDLRGLKAFSRRSFERQLSVPGLVMFRAMDGGTAVGAHLWYVQGDVAYSHLEASADRGYELMASYGLYAHAMRWFAGKVRWLDLGAGAGASEDDADSLGRFKRGWSRERRAAYLCGRRLNPQEYDRLVAGRAASDRSYFPAYRAGELV